MIIDWRFDSLHYERKIKRNTKELSYLCPICKEKHTFIYHGYYERNLIRWNGWVEEKKIRILRIKCTNCRHTQAVLPWDVIPHKIYSMSYYWKLLRLLTLKQEKISQCIYIMSSYATHIYYIIKSFIKMKGQITEYIELLRNFLGIHKIHQFQYYTTWIVNSQNV